MEDSDQSISAASRQKTEDVVASCSAQFAMLSMATAIELNLTNESSQPGKRISNSSQFDQLASCHGSSRCHDIDALSVSCRCIELKRHARLHEPMFDVRAGQQSSARRRNSRNRCASRCRSLPQPVVSLDDNHANNITRLRDSGKKIKRAIRSKSHLHVDRSTLDTLCLNEMLFV